MTSETCTLQLTPCEFALLLKYGLPFDEDADLLGSSKIKNGVHVAHADPYWISMWTADIARSAKKLISRSLLVEFDALRDVLENAENHRRRVRWLSLG